MDLSIIISLIAMISTVVSTVIAIIQVRKCKKEITSIKAEMYTMIKNSEESKATITNKGENSGVMAQEVKGGIHFGK